MTYRADLHCHSTCSDGTCTPIELLHLAKEQELRALSITDHDTLSAYTQETFAEAEKLGVHLFVGVEFSTRLYNIGVHILGYGVESTSELTAFCATHKKWRYERNGKILEKLRQLSLVVTEEELYRGREEVIVGRPHIAQIMVEKKYVLTIQEAFDRYIGERKCCFDPGPSFTVQETIDQIHQARGKAFIAHPHLLRSSRLLRTLYQMDFDGIECYYSLFPNAKEQKWLQIAKRRNWLISGGSDFHGSIKPHISLGCSWVEEEEIKSIFGRS